MTKILHLMGMRLISSISVTRGGVTRSCPPNSAQPINPPATETALNLSGDNHCTAWTAKLKLSSRCG